MYPGEYAKQNADQPIFIMATSGAVLTFGEYERRCNQVARLYRSLGLRHRDHVAVFMENNMRMLEVEGAAERAGLYYTCINSYLSADEVAYIVNDSESQVFVTSLGKAEIATQLPPLCPNVRRWLMVDGTAGDFEPYEETIAEFPADPIPDEQQGAAMLYSSGTTGRPKGILRPLGEARPDTPLPVMAFVQNMFRVRPGMVYLSPAPLYHSAPQASVATAVRLGSTSIIMEHFDAAQWLDLVERYRVTHCQMVPTMFSRLLKLPAESRDHADVSSIEVIIHAAAPCPVPVKQQMIEWLGPKLIEYYGATEGNGFTWCDSEQWLAHPGTVGKSILGDVVIRDDAGDECPVGTAGTVWLRGATNFEYFNDPAKTAEGREDTPAGVMSTVGDVGYLDADGYLYLTDRKTYMIISGGVNIYPQETENLLITHPKVMDAAVIGVPDDDLGEEVKAIVQATSDVTPGPDLERELIAFCRDHLAHFKCPRSVDFLDELPRLPTGKLYKRLLRERYWEGRSTSIV